MRSNDSVPRTDAMRSIHQANTTSSKPRKSVLLGTSALVCLALSAPVMAEDFVITSGTTTNDGETINGADTVTVTGALVTTGLHEGIDTSGGVNTVTVSETGSITTGAGNNAYGIRNIGTSNETTVSGSINSKQIYIATFEIPKTLN